MTILPTDYTDANTPSGATTELPATTTRGINAINTQINTNTTAISTLQGAQPTGAVVGTTDTQTLTHKTLTDATNVFPTFNQNTTGSAATLTTSRNIDGQAFNGSADITVIAPGTHAATSKTTPVDADELALVDSAASNVLKKLTWANLKAAIKSYYDSVTSTLTNKDLTSGTNTFPTFNQNYFASKTGAYTLTAADDFIAADATSAAFTLTLPTAVSAAGRQYTVKKVDSTTHAVTIATTSSQTIDGITNQYLVFQYHEITMVSDGSNWLIVSNNYHGRELGYAEATASATTTNSTTTDAGLTSNKLSGLSITVIGAGRPVVIGYSGQGLNSGAGNYVVAQLLINGSATSGTAAVMCGAVTLSMGFQRRMVLTAGTSYTFEIGKWVSAGTGTFYASPTTAPISVTALSVLGA